MEEYSDFKKLIPLGQTPMESNIDDEIKLYRPKKKGKNRVIYYVCFRVVRFFMLVLAFFAVYYCLYQLYLKNAKVNDDVPASAYPEETFAEETAPKDEFRLPLIINESKREIDYISIFEEDNYFRLPPGDGVKIIIVNSHSGEKVAGDIAVTEISDDLLRLLQSRGISAYLDDTQYDAEGTIGAYKRMSDNVSKLKNIYKEAVVVIDLHNSDSGVPLTFTVGTSDNFAWQENLRLACAIYKYMDDKNVAIRMLPTSLGQDNGLLNINVGIGGSECTAIEARETVSAFLDSLTLILQNVPLA